MMKNTAISEVKGVISDGILTGEIPSYDFERHYVTVDFLNNDTLVDKSTMTGNVKVEFSENGNDYGTIINGTIELGSVTYDRPHVAGSYKTFKLDLNGITDAGSANNVVVTVYSHE